MFKVECLKLILFFDNYIERHIGVCLDKMLRTFNNIIVQHSTLSKDISDVSVYNDAIK